MKTIKYIIYLVLSALYFAYGYELIKMNLEYAGSDIIVGVIGAVIALFCFERAGLIFVLSTIAGILIGVVK